MRRRIIIGLALASLLASPAALPAAILESPAKQAVLSGIGFISGWKCDARNITVTIDGGAYLPVAMHQERGDLRAVCGTIQHGFIRQINWGLVGDGEHEAVAYDNGVEFDRATFSVGSTGAAFLKGAVRWQLLGNFPEPGETTVLEWNESTQHFEIRWVVDSLMAGGYDRAYWRQVSVELIEGTYSQAEFLYDKEPDPDTCRPGRLTQAAKARALEAMNQIRALHGLEPVQYSYRYDQQVQAAALIQAANRFVTHYPTPYAECYTADGAEGSRANLTGYLVDPRINLDPARNMIHWTADNDGPGRIRNPASHRRWMLNPFAAYMSYGQVLGYSAQKVFGFDAEPAITPRIAVHYVAFPYETYPSNLVGRITPWSFSVVEDKRGLRGNAHPYFENATITVRRVSDRTALIISHRYSDTIGYGVPNFLSWQVEGWEYDTLYEVEISNVTLQSGATLSYSYPVFIERTSLEQ